MAVTSATERRSEQAADKAAIRPFQVNVPEAELTDLRRRVALPVSWTREGDTNIAAPRSIVDPDATERSRVIGHAATSAARAATGVR